MNNNNDNNITHTPDTSGVKDYGSKKRKKGFDFGLILSYGVALGGICIASAIIYWVVVPQVSEYRSSKKEFKELEGELKKVKSQADYLEGLSQLQDELSANIELSKQAIPLAKNDIPFMLEQLIDMGRSTGIEISSLGFGGISSSTENSELQEVKIQIRIAGTYDQTMSFLKELERSRRLVDITSIQISKETASEKDAVSQENYNLNLSLVSYFMPDIDTNNLNVENLISNSDHEVILNKLQGLEFYDIKGTTLQVGKDNPFEEGVDIITGEKIEEDESDGFGSGANTSPGNPSGSIINIPPPTPVNEVPPVPPQPVNTNTSNGAEVNAPVVVQ